MAEAKPMGRPKQFDRRLRVPMTEGQRSRVDALADAEGCSAAEAIRRLIDGAPMPEARSAKGLTPEQYDQITRAIGKVRTELNVAGGNLYRLVRDSYGGQVPDESEVAGVRATLDHGVSELARLATAVARWSPW